METYEISLWENVWVDSELDDGKGYYDERKICVIGANDMATPIRAIEPKFVDNINGTHEFSFKMYKQYTDNTTGEIILNPFDMYLTNERKVKVFWKDKWYDFIIKKIQENSADKSLIYTCQDLFIYELSKNGYELNFDTELKNNIGSARTLITETIKDTTWKFDPDSEEILQTYNSPVIYTESVNSFEVLNQTFEAYHPLEDSSFTVEANKKMLVFYDSIIDVYSLNAGDSIVRDIQLICDNSNSFTTELNSNLVIDNNCLLAKNITITKAGGYYIFRNASNTLCFQLPLDFQVSSQYRGERFIDTEIQEYDENLNRYVVKCKDINNPSKTVYRTTITKDNNPLKVFNLVANPTDFRNTAGWEPDSNNNSEFPTNVKIYPDNFPANREYENFNVESSLKIKGKVYNNGFIANANKFRVNASEQKEGKQSGIQKGDKFTFRFRGFENEVIPRSEVVIPTRDYTPVQPAGLDTRTDWEKMPVYIYLGEVHYPYGSSSPSWIDAVGRLLQISILSEGISDFTHFQFNTTYAVVSYGATPILFGLNTEYLGGNRVRITNRHESEYKILDEPLIINTNEFTAFRDYSDYATGPVVTPHYGFTFEIENGQVDYSKLRLVVTQSYTYEFGEAWPAPYYVTTALSRSPVQVFGPIRSNILYDFMRNLIERQAYSNSATGADFTSDEIALFYDYDSRLRYHPNTSDKTDSRIQSSNAMTRTFITMEQRGWDGPNGPKVGPDFVERENFYIYTGESFSLLIDNIAERIYMDVPLSTTNMKIYESIENGLITLKKRDRTLRQKIGRGYFYVNGTDKELNLGTYDYTPIEGETPHEYTAGNYVIYITTVNDRIYNSENQTLSWDNYQVGDFIAHLFKCLNDNVIFDANDTTNWILLDKDSEDFPLLKNGASWKNDNGTINGDVIYDSINQYSFHGYSGDYSETGLGPVDSAALQQAVQQHIANISLPDPPDLDTATPEDLALYQTTMTEFYSRISGMYAAQFSIYDVYSLGCYILSRGSGELYGEFDKLLVYTFQPLIYHLEQKKLQFYNPEINENIFYVEAPEINDYIQQEEYDSDFPVLSNYIDNNDLIFNFQLYNENVFSFEGPVISNNGWVQYSLVAIKEVPLNKIKEIQFFLETPANAPIWLDNIQLFKNQYIQIDGQDTLIYPGEEFQWQNTKILYNYYEKSGSTITSLYIGPDLQSNYPPITSNYYKRATINIRRSNRFNILQTIAEAFNGWIYFDIKHDINGRILLDQNNSPQKYVGIQQKKGNEVNITFEYGIDLKEIQRSIDSNQLTTKIYVLQNSNEFGQDGFCTISRSRQNLTKAPFILDFSYFVQAGLINEEALNRNLYEWYYPQMNHLYSILDIKNAELIQQREKILRLQAQLSVYDNYATSAREEWFSLKQELYLFTSGFDMSQNKKVQGIQSSIQMTEQKIQKYETMYSNLYTNVSSLEDSIEDLQEEVTSLTEQLNGLHTEFNNIYWPFIFEGTWTDEKYIDDDKYYLDGLTVAANSSRPQLTYDINLIRVSDLYEFSAKEFHVGDICYIIDREFFGYLSDGITPFKERIIVNKITSYFDSPDKDVVEVKNYRSKFDDLFQKIVATTQSLKFAEGDYTKVAKAITSNRTISYDLLQDTFDYNENLILNVSNQDVTWDETGITISNKENGADKTRIIAGGIFLTNDGGKTWKNAVRGDGISANVLTSGRINSGEIYIYDKEYPMFRWDRTGISAYSCTPREEQINGENIQNYVVNFSKFVRFDKFGLYGYSNPSNNAYLDDFVPKTEEEIWLSDYTKFGLTWKGFFLKSTSENGGYVKITTDGDLIRYPNGSLDRKIVSSGIGNKETFYLTQNGNAVFSGELQAAKGTFAGESSTSVLTLDDGGLVLKILENGHYKSKFKIKYITTEGYVYPYLELGNDSSSFIILRRASGLYLGPKTFTSLHGLTISSYGGVYVTKTYTGTISESNHNPQDYMVEYNIAEAFYRIEQELGISIGSGPLPISGV